LTQARDFSEFRVALSTAVTPSYNVLYADNNGNIGMQVNPNTPTMLCYPLPV
jgi:acyl-homoserine lactone acylase PvdQ